MGNIQAFWQAYLDSRPPETAVPDSYDVWSFGMGAEQAEALGQLVRKGIKTATCGLLWEYEAEGESLPQAGDHSLITGGEGEPLAIIETTEAEIKAYNEVDARFAYDEGEEDRSLAYWRQVHWEDFSHVCKTLGREPSQTMPLVCERFRLVFPK